MCGAARFPINFAKQLIKLAQERDKGGERWASGARYAIARAGWRAGERAALLICWCKSWSKKESHCLRCCCLVLEEVCSVKYCGDVRVVEAQVEILIVEDDL